MVRTEKGFKEVHLNTIAKLVFEFAGQEVTSTQIYNHLRKWRVRWIKVSKLKELSGAHWDEDTSSIILELEHLRGSDVSIIFDVPCLIIYQCHMFLYHFGMIYGTNLLTRCPVPVPVFCCPFVSEKLFVEVSRNQMQIYRNYFQAETSLEPGG